MAELDPTLPWTQPAWIQQAHAWIHASLAAAGLRLTGPIDQFHARIWSTVMRCPTSSGTVYFKACQRLTEPRLTVFLRDVQPQNLPDLTAVDLERGWLLMPDAGPMLRRLIQSPDDLGVVEPALEQFATLQIRLAPAVIADPQRFLALGAADRRPAALPAQFTGLLADADSLGVGRSDGLTPAEMEQLAANLPHFTAMCQELAAGPVPLSLHHDDFHDGNIFVSGQPGAYRYVFSDWDECAVTHPFFSLMHCLRSVGSRAGFPDEATETPEGLPAELVRLRDAYLRPWLVYASAEALQHAFQVAWRVGMVSRALTWREFVRSIEPHRRADFSYIVPAWLREYLLAWGKRRRSPGNPATI